MSLGTASADPCMDGSGPLKSKGPVGDDAEAERSALQGVSLDERAIWQLAVVFSRDQGSATGGKSWKKGHSAINEQGRASGRHGLMLCSSAFIRSKLSAPDESCAQEIARYTLICLLVVLGTWMLRRFLTALCWAVALAIGATLTVKLPLA